MRQLLNKQPRLAMGVRIALMVFAQSKVAASASSVGNAAIIPPGFPEMPEKKAVQEFLAQETVEATASGKEIFETAVSVFDDLVDAAETSATSFNYFFQQPLSHDHLRLWLQCYNAGPYATLKYKGNVPYKETMNYTPRVLKYYAQDLSKSPYEGEIVESAKKYGLDPQMVRAIIKTESDFNNKCVSHAGARGLMQVMPCVWTEIRQRYDLEWEYKKGVFNPEKNIEVACAYLAWLRYDFLPKHFADFDANPVTPPELVRDRRLKQSVNRIVLSAASNVVPATNPVANGVKVTFTRARRAISRKAESVRAATSAKKKPAVSREATSKPSKKTVADKKSRSRRRRS